MYTKQLPMILSEVKRFYHMHWCDCIGRHKRCDDSPSLRICDWIWQNPASTQKTSLGDMVILSKHCLIILRYLWLCKQNLQQLFIYSLYIAIIVWTCTFLTQRICPVLGSFFWTGNNNTTGGSNRGGGWGSCCRNQTFHYSGLWKDIGL